MEMVIDMDTNTVTISEKHQQSNGNDRNTEEDAREEEEFPPMFYFDSEWSLLHYFTGTTTPSHHVMIPPVTSIAIISDGIANSEQEPRKLNVTPTQSSKGKLHTYTRTNARTRSTCTTSKRNYLSHFIENSDYVAITCATTAQDDEWGQFVDLGGGGFGQ